MYNGIQIVDCAGLNLLGGSTPQTKTGLYNKVKKALSRKNLLIVATNTTYGEGHPMSPIPVFAQQESSTQIICTSSILQLMINADDTVTISSLVTQ